MVQYMSTHTDFARNRIAELGVNGSIKSQEMWEELQCNLNALAGPKLETSELQQVNWEFENER